MMKTLYVNRPLTNSAEFVGWAKKSGFESTLEPKEIHCTIAYSKKKLDWSKVPKDQPDKLTAKKSLKREVKPLGDKGAVVLKFESPELQKRWKEICDAGGSWDYPSFQAHVTISYNGKDVDLSKIAPYVGPLEFGPEKWKEIDDNWENKVKEK